MNHFNCISQTYLAWKLKQISTFKEKNGFLLNSVTFISKAQHREKKTSKKCQTNKKKYQNDDLKPHQYQ